MCTNVAQLAIASYAVVGLFLGAMQLVHHKHAKHNLLRVRFDWWRADAYTESGQKWRLLSLVWGISVPIVPFVIAHLPREWCL